MSGNVNESLSELPENATTTASREGVALAYSSLVIMALIPIFFGSFRSISCLKKQKDSGEKPEIMSHKDAAKFPLIASCALLGLYVFFKIFSKEYIDLLVTVYFFGLGVFSVSYLLSPAIKKLLPDSLNVQHHVVYTKNVNGEVEEVLNANFTNKDAIILGICALPASYYLWNKHWILNNVFGLSFALNGVELLHLNNIVIGCTLLGGLFVYDIFWVFGTDVMVTVAKSFEAPIKLVFPQDIFENWLDGKNFAMLGLGDIVIPGIFIALLLRFDKSLERKSYLYFYSSFFAYFIGLVVTICVMSYFKHAQPALLYLVPVCIATPMSIAALKGDINALFSYEDHPQESASTGAGEESHEGSDSKLDKTSESSAQVAPEKKKVK